MRIYHTVFGSITGGNSYTVLIANVWAELEQLSETVTSITYTLYITHTHTHTYTHTCTYMYMYVPYSEKIFQDS